VGKTNKIIGKLLPWKGDHPHIVIENFNKALEVVATMEIYSGRKFVK
jgi:hypothetical protein